MIVLLLRVDTIDRGEGGDPGTFPVASASLQTIDGMQVARFEGASIWQEIDEPAGWQSRPVRLLVDEEPEVLLDQRLSGSMTVIDRTGTEVCGQMSFTVGAAIYLE